MTGYGSCGLQMQALHIMNLQAQRDVCSQTSLILTQRGAKDFKLFRFPEVYCTFTAYRTSCFRGAPLSAGSSILFGLVFFFMVHEGEKRFVPSAVASSTSSKRVIFEHAAAVDRPLWRDRRVNLTCLPVFSFSCSRCRGWGTEINGTGHSSSGSH